MSIVPSVPFGTVWTGTYGLAAAVVSNPANAISSSTSDFATFLAVLSATGGMRLTAQSDNGYYPAGYFAGFEIQNTGIIGATLLGSLTVRTYLGTTLQEQYTGPGGLLAANIVNTNGRTTVGFVTTKNFDRIQIDQALSISVNLGTTQIFNAVATKFCAESTPRPCNVVEQWNNPTFPVYVNTDRTGISTNVACVNCAVRNTTNLVNSDATDYAEIDLVASIASTGSVSIKNTKTIYPAGTFAGFEIEDQRTLGVAFAAGHTVTTYLNGVQQETVSDGGALGSAGLFTSSGHAITGFKTKLAFDEIQFSVSMLGAVQVAPIRVYGAVTERFCEGPALACNTNTKLVKPNYPVFVDTRNTGIDATACVQCNIVASGNAIDADPDNYTELVVPANIGTTAAYGVTDGAKIYPINTFAGFDIDNPNLIGVNALSGITISTTDQYGAVIESFSGNSGLISAKSSVLNGAGRQTIGFLATQPFSGVKITVSSVINANIGTTRIYNAVFKAFCANELACNTLTAVSNPTHPVYVNGIRTSIDAVGCAACQLNNSENIVNGAVIVPATLVMGASVGSKATVSVANAIETYPAESFAGFDIESGTLLSAGALGSMTIHLYNDGVLVQSGTGNSLAAGVSTSLVTGGANRQIVGIISKVPFDEAQLEITNLVGADLGNILIYRAYMQRSCAITVGCDFNVTLSDQNHGAVIDAEQTGTKGIACAGCEVQAPWNAVSASTTDFARIHNLASGLETNSLAVAVPATTFPAGTFAGFTIKKNPFLLSGGLFTGITITTYLNGVQQESKNDAALFDLSVLNQWFGTPSDFYNPGFYSTVPFDEIKISIGSLAQAVDQFVDVYGAIVDTRMAVGLSCNKTNPDVNVALAGVAINGNVSTNDMILPGTTYGSATTVAGFSNPGGELPAVNADGTYTFTSSTPGVYRFLVPVCPPSVTTNCPVELLVITVNGTGTNNPPIANLDIASTKLNTAVTINSLVNDAAGNKDVLLVPGSVVLTDLNGGNSGNTRLGGTAVVNSATGAVTYTPPTGIVGKDTILYTVSDNRPIPLSASAYQIVTVSLTGTTNSTEAADDYALLSSPTGITANAANGVKANDTDPEGDTQTVTPQTTTVPDKGTLTLQDDGSYNFVPVATFKGGVGFPYTTTDSQGATAMATLYISGDQAALPVTLIEFKATSEGGQALLSWATTSETNSDYFEVQHSRDAKNWRPLGRVESFGESAIRRDYTFVHQAMVPGENYYRLKMVDKDQTFAYSGIRNVESGVVGLATYPNPVSDKIFLNDLPGRKISRVTITNSSGTVVYSGKNFPAAGIKVTNWAAGMYVIEVTETTGLIHHLKTAVQK
ncbi:MAG: cadherin-like domain-containing protein [Dyadobacter sp.]|uniref:Ig-like domain-containing protein n=1 Tax=Dyadobacter sp. TaxID=1914288 RepID=UPI001B227D82|nr:Ig-like domain-containing protein [Dyadobacter sp.]MBO9611370.1 cadherin-like domain-containing protein [Dyadobacter sp.]